MLISVVRNTLVDGQIVDAGTVIDASPPVAQQLIAMHKAVAVAPPPTPPHMVGVEHAVDVAAMAAQRRDANWGEALVSAIDGIGPVTARRLAEAGIATMAELLAADPAHVALIASVKTGQVEKWRQRAQAVIDGE